VFVPPSGPSRSRLSRDDFSSGSTLTRSIDDGGGPEFDAHFSARDLAAEAAAITKAAADSIRRPARLAERGTNHD